MGRWTGGWDGVRWSICSGGYSLGQSALKSALFPHPNHSRALAQMLHPIGKSVAWMSLWTRTMDTSIIESINWSQRHRSEAHQTAICNSATGECGSLLGQFKTAAQWRGWVPRVTRLSDECTYNNLYQIYTYIHSHRWTEYLENDSIKM